MNFRIRVGAKLRDSAIIGAGQRKPGNFMAETGWVIKQKSPQLYAEATLVLIFIRSPLYDDF